MICRLGLIDGGRGRYCPGVRALLFLDVYVCSDCLSVAGRAKGLHHLFSVGWRRVAQLPSRLVPTFYLMSTPDTAYQESAGRRGLSSPSVRDFRSYMCLSVLRDEQTCSTRSHGLTAPSNLVHAQNGLLPNVRQSLLRGANPCQHFWRVAHVPVVSWRPPLVKVVHCHRSDVLCFRRLPGR